MPAAVHEQNQSLILVYGDTPDHQMGRILWSQLSGQDVKIEFPQTIQELDDHAPKAVLIVVVIGPNGEHADLARRFTSRPEIPAEIMGIDPQSDVPDRMRHLGAGFDTIFNLEMTTWVDFRNILIVKLEKGRVRQKNAFQRDEYRRFRASLAASPDAFIVFDNEKRLFFVSDHYKRFYGPYASRLVRGLPVADAFNLAFEFHGLTPDHPIYELSAAFWLNLEGQIEFPLPDGRIWRCTATPLPDDQGTIITTTDVTDYRAQQKELREKTEELSEALEKEQAASALQKQFIGMVSHEFRTPLTIIDGHAQILQRRADQLDADTIRNRTKTIRSAVSRLVNMMESVLSSSLLTTGTLEPHPEDFDLSALLHELCDEQAALASTHSISCDVTGLPATVRQDRKMMTLVCTNILANAVKFSKNDPAIMMTARMAGHDIEISIQDNGVGIPEAEIDKIFDRYYRASTASGIPGTGIGLSLVRDLVRLMGGCIQVESAIGQGTMMKIIVPDLNSGSAV